MFSPSTLNILLQLVAAIVIFAFGYLALMLCAMAAFVLANLIYKAAHFSWVHVISKAVPAHGVSVKISNHTPSFHTIESPFSGTPNIQRLHLRRIVK
jgi:hypothetical protein